MVEEVHPVQPQPASLPVGRHPSDNNNKHKHKQQNQHETSDDQTEQQKDDAKKGLFDEYV